MAYMSQERKKEIVALCKPILKKYGVKATFGVRNHSALECNIKSGKINFFAEYQGKNYGDYIDVNVYHYRNSFEGKSKEFLTELIAAMHTGNHDNSDITTDYFDVGWYIDVNIGKWNKKYIFEG